MITCNHGERNDDESCWNCENDKKDLAADLRQLHRDAALAALSGMSTKTGYHTWPDLISDVNVIADEFIRQYNPDAVIAEVAG